MTLALALVRAAFFSSGFATSSFFAFFHPPFPYAKPQSRGELLLMPAFLRSKKQRSGLAVSAKAWLMMSMRFATGAAQGKKGEKWQKG